MSTHAGASLGSTPAFDRSNGMVDGATAIEAAAVRFLQAGSKLTQRFGHRGYSLGCEWVAAAVPGRDIAIRLNDDAWFAVPLGDRYWSRLLNRAYSYEEEIEVFLRNAADTRYVFVDCGANFGYWSILASSAPFGRQHAIAIEASPANAYRLRRNAALNGNRFRVFNAAVGRHAGGFVHITGHKHEAFGTMPVEAGQANSVPVVSLDSLICDGIVDGAKPVVVKLDVEGVEIEAIRGGMQLIGGNAVLVCEEHGSDPEHRVSRWLMGAAGLRVFVFEPGTGRFVPVHDMDILDRLKIHRWVGYNVFATSSGFWEKRLLSAARGTQ